MVIMTTMEFAIKDIFANAKGFLMKINVIGMILNNAGRHRFEGAILDDNGKPMSAANSLHAMIMEYAKVINGGQSDIVTTSREVTSL